MPVTKWRSRKGAELNQFFTNDGVSNSIVEAIGAHDVHSILDLGSGAGSLSVAAASKWPTADVTSVDVDAAVEDTIRDNLQSVSTGRHSHHIYDVLNPRLCDVVGNVGFDLAVCNPPFYRPKWAAEFNDILGSAGLSDACPSVAEVTAEIIFLAQNLRFVWDGGFIALIVPDGLATGRRFASFRRAVMSENSFKSVIQLPPYSFEDTEAYCFVMIIE